jgi:hypothetical protein
VLLLLTSIYEAAMFRKNQHHLQPALLSDLDHLTAKQRKRLDASWAGVFRREVFARLDETPFAVLYAQEDSRPNIPVNVLIGLETLKAGRGWSDEEMHDAFAFDLQVRYALGYENLGEGEFDLRTVYNFRHRLSHWMQTHGENLLDQAFVQVTDAQVAAFQLTTRQLRMDTTQIASNIRVASRLQLLVEVLQRVQRMLTAADQTHYAELLAPYAKGSAGQYVYHLKGEETAPHLQRIGEVMQQLVAELATGYGANPIYQVLQRVFQEHFQVSPASVPPPPGAEVRPADVPPPGAEVPPASVPPPGAELRPASVPPPGAEVPPASVPPPPGAELRPASVQPRPGTELSADSLRSVDDVEATFRRKGAQTYQGYATNVTETCAPENPFQLILAVQTVPNVTEDAHLLLEIVPALKGRTGVETLYNDAGFCSRAVDRLLHTLDIVQVPSNIKGEAPNPNRLGLADFHLTCRADGTPEHIRCPQGQSVSVIVGQAPERYHARFATAECTTCPLAERCPTRRGAQADVRSLAFSQTQVDVAQRRQRCLAYHHAQHNLRAAVEATVGAVKRPFSNDQVPVRGQFRVGAMMLGSALMVNVRRMQRYRIAKAKATVTSTAAKREESTSNSMPTSFLLLLRNRFKRAGIGYPAFRPTW